MDSTGTNDDGDARDEQGAGGFIDTTATDPTGAGGGDDAGENGADGDGDDEGPGGLVRAGTRDIGAFAVGPLGFGCWRFTPATTAEGRAVIDAALEAGMELIDTADCYGLDFGGAGFGAAEEALGRVLAEDPELRDAVVLATKGGIREEPPYDSSPAWLRTACESSLRRLGVESIDLYQLHRHDPFTHPGDVAEVLSELRDEGKIGEVGVSNHTPAQFRALQTFLPFPIATTQPEVSVAHLDTLSDGSEDLAVEEGLTVLAYSPLAGGRVATGEGLPPALLAVLDELAGREGVHRTAVALAFVLSLPSAPVALIGSQDTDHIAAAADALTVHLDRSDCFRIIEASTGREMP